MVVGFDRDLPLDVGASIRLVGRQPRRGVARTLGLVRAAIGGLQIARIVGEVAALLGRKLLRAFLPRVGQRDDVVDLDL
ncbi:Uncharacterised protein [Mycobacteroides abscessus subsp. abscessus]|nr:Uncharacterised protein [Mycobacteroides abscessus subsp. abscessus]